MSVSNIVVKRKKYKPNSTEKELCECLMCERKLDICKETYNIDDDEEASHIIPFKTIKKYSNGQKIEDSGINVVLCCRDCNRVCSNGTTSYDMFRYFQENNSITLEKLKENIEQRKYNKQKQDFLIHHAEQCQKIVNMNNKKAK